MLIILYLCTFISMMIPSATLALDVYVKNSMWQWNPPLKVSYNIFKEDINSNTKQLHFGGLISKTATNRISKEMLIQPNEIVYIGTAESFFTDEGNGLIKASLEGAQIFDFLLISYPKDEAFKILEGDLIVDVRRPGFGFGNGIVHTQTFRPHTVYFRIKNDSSRDIELMITQPTTDPIGQTIKLLSTTASLMRPSHTISLKRGAISARLPFDMLKDNMDGRANYHILLTSNGKMGKRIAVPQKDAEAAFNDHKDLYIRIELDKTAEETSEALWFKPTIQQMDQIGNTSKGLFARFLAKFKTTNKSNNQPSPREWAITRFFKNLWSKAPRVRRQQEFTNTPPTEIEDV